MLTTNFGLTQTTCDIERIRDIFLAEGCIELSTCVSECSMYFLNPKSMTASDAQSFAEGLGANLISIHSKDENDCILSALSAITPKVLGYVWIGLNDEVVEGEFVWYDQSPLTYTNWAPNEPNDLNGNEDCVQIFTDDGYNGSQTGMWNDLYCDVGHTKSIIEVSLCPLVDAGPNIAICDGETATIQSSPTILGSAPYTYQWNNNGPTDYPNSVTPDTTTDYIMSTEDRYNCTGVDTMTVIVNPIPTVNAGKDINICVGDSVTLNGTDNNGTWDHGVNNGIAFVPSSTQTYTYTVNSHGCIDSSKVEVVVNSSPTPDFSGDLLIGCQPHMVNFINTNGLINEICTWDFGDGSTSNVCNSVSHTYTESGVYDVTLTLENEYNCIGYTTYASYIEVVEDPTAEFIADPMTTNLNDTKVEFTNTSINATNYIWDFGDLSPQSIETNPIHIFPSENVGDYYVILHAINDLGCKDSTSLMIQVGPLDFNYSIPNVFTPNGDGNNDVFKFIKSENILEIEVIILNRWGNVVFESDDVNFKWDGSKHNNGTECTDGTYFYKINFKDMNGEQIEEHGFVQLSRGK